MGEAVPSLFSYQYVKNFERDLRVLFPYSRSSSITLVDLTGESE